MIRGHDVSVALFAYVFLVTDASAQEQDFGAVEIVPHHVTGNVYYLEGAGGNIGLSVGEDGVVLIDDQCAPLTDKIVAAIKEISDREIRFVINTHVHGDHTGGNENLGQLGVVILARDEVRVRLSETATAGALPVLTFSDSVTIYMNGDEVHAFGVPPAHTDGDSYVHFPGANVIHTCDIFRTTGYPYIDKANGGTLAGLIEALELLVDLADPDARIIPGHGDVANESSVVAMIDMIRDVSDEVRALIKQGMSFDEVVAARPTAEHDNTFGDPLRFLAAVYTELGGSP